MKISAHPLTTWTSLSSNVLTIRYIRSTSIEIGNLCYLLPQVPPPEGANQSMEHMHESMEWVRLSNTFTVSYSSTPWSVGVMQRVFKKKNLSYFNSNVQPSLFTGFPRFFL